MSAMIAELTMWLVALLTVGGIAAYVLKRLFTSGGSVAVDFQKQVAKAEALDKEIKNLREGSTRDAINFQEALKKHRATYGTGKRPSPPDKPTI